MLKLGWQSYVLRGWLLSQSRIRCIYAVNYDVLVLEKKTWTDICRASASHVDPTLLILDILLHGGIVGSENARSSDLPLVNSCWNWGQVLDHLAVIKTTLILHRSRWARRFLSRKIITFRYVIIDDDWSNSITLKLVLSWFRLSFFVFVPRLLIWFSVFLICFVSQLFSRI
jgi:hypothetical protein